MENKKDSALKKELVILEESKNELAGTVATKIICTGIGIFGLLFILLVFEANKDRNTFTQNMRIIMLLAPIIFILFGLGYRPTSGQEIKKVRSRILEIN